MYKYIYFTIIIINNTQNKRNTIQNKAFLIKTNFKLLLFII